MEAVRTNRHEYSIAQIASIFNVTKRQVQKWIDQKKILNARFIEHRKKQLMVVAEKDLHNFVMQWGLRLYKKRETLIETGNGQVDFEKQ